MCKFLFFFLAFSYSLLAQNLDENSISVDKSIDRTGINFIIPAAGNAKRLKSDIPKALHNIGEKTSLEIIVDNISNFFRDYNKEIVVVVSEKMLTDFSKLLPLQANYAIQKKKLGTADAVEQAFGLINKTFPVTSIIWGDCPLNEEQNMKKAVELILNKKCDIVYTAVLNLKQEKKGGKLSLVNKTLNLSNIKIGDIIKINDITEKADLKDDEEPAILINAGMSAFNTSKLLKFIGKINNKNTEKERYLPHFIKLSHKYKMNACALVIDSKNGAALGYNTPEELNNLSMVFNAQ